VGFYALRAASTPDRRHIARFSKKNCVHYIARFSKKN
jgi:hypothetical protein